MDRTGHRLLKVIHTLCTSAAVTDTIWLPGRGATTVCEELAAIAMDEHGATEEQVNAVLQGKNPTAAAGEGHSSI